MSRSLRYVLVIVGGALVLSGAGRPLHGQIAGPDGLPAQLPGLWRVSLCVSHQHAWICFQHHETGAVHTLGRYSRCVGGEFDWRTCRRTWPNSPGCGVIWDIDRKYHIGVRTDGCELRSCYVWNSCIYRGHANGYGHWVIRVNCTDYARDAWHYYSGEWYDLPLIAMPCHLRNGVCSW